MGAEWRKEGSLEERVGRGLPVPLPLCILWKGPGTGGHTSVPGYDKATHSRHFWPGCDPDLALGAAPGSHTPAWCPAGPTKGLGATVWLRPNPSTAPMRMNPWPQPQTDP